MSQSENREFIYKSIVTETDITPYGSASFINYVRWYGRARDAFLNFSNLDLGGLEKRQVEVEVVCCEVSYKKELFLHENFIIKVMRKDKKSQGLMLELTLLRQEDSSLVSTCLQEVVFRNNQNGELLKLIP